MPQRTMIPSDYAGLLKSVKQTLIEGQKRIESERVRIYWETGRLINDHVLGHKDRAEYGAQVIDKIANDLNVEHTILKRCVKFARQYPKLPISAGGHQLGWSHYRQLITIPNEKDRLLIEKRSTANAWTAEELGERLKDGKNSRPQEKSDRHPSQKSLTPLRGELYTYRIVTRPTVGAGEDSGLLIDLGFGIFHECDSRSVVEGDIVRSSKRDDNYRLTKIETNASALFTYNGYVERVIDGDTLKVRLDLGFGTFSRHTLRLRGIDCPEMSTKAGEEAKAFVQSYIKEAQRIIVRSSRSDKYDRYLADVFLPAEEGKFIYLNNLLLENGHAVRM